MTLNITVADRTREEWIRNHAQASVLYVMLAVFIGLPLDMAGVVSSGVAVAVALAGYVLLTAHFLYQMRQADDG